MFSSENINPCPRRVRILSVTVLYIRKVNNREQKRVF